jgi:hypothetical protein
MHFYPPHYTRTVAALRLRPVAVGNAQHAVSNDTNRLSGRGDRQNASLCGQFAQKRLITTKQRTTQTANLEKLSTQSLAVGGVFNPHPPPYSEVLTKPSRIPGSVGKTSVTI